VAWVLDLDGVIWLADEPVPGAADAIRRLRQADEHLVFVTNNSFAPPGLVVDRLRAMGIEADGDVLTSAAAAATLLREGERVLVCGGPGLRQAVEDRRCEVVDRGPAETVVVGYDPAFDYQAMTTAAAAVRGGARLVASNDDATYPTPSGPIPGAGSILASIATASAVTPIVSGKPHGPMRDLVLARCGPDGIVVGDRPDTDGRFAVALGYRFGLVLTGVTGPDDLPVEPAPDVTATDLATLVAGSGF
jgi:HAD superfamily hydrolase (TIGR01450 family)